MISQNWPSLNVTAELATENALRAQYTEALRKVNPNSGCYLNEACLHFLPALSTRYIRN